MPLGTFDVELQEQPPGINHFQCPSMLGAHDWSIQSRLKRVIDVACKTGLVAPGCKDLLFPKGHLAQEFSLVKRGCLFIGYIGLSL
eukprot:1889704-Amphidinium_carterae.1